MTFAEIHQEPADVQQKVGLENTNLMNEWRTWEDEHNHINK